MNQKENQKKEILKRSFLTIKELNKKLEQYERAKNEPIAIVGMGCRFPGGADTPEAFWHILRDGKDVISEVPSNRWKLEDYFDENQETPGKIYTRYGGFLKNIDQFDAHFFRISAREAQDMDPQQRLLLEVSWEALENGGCFRNGQTEKETGVFVGITQIEYAQLIASSGSEAISSFFGTGNSLNVAAGRLAYFYGFQGPSLAIDTACSSSLVSVHLACQSLRNGECKQALAGGVNLILTPAGSIATSQAKMLAPDGRCKTFDASADGYVRSEGCGLIVLKKLSDAIQEGSPILAVIKSSVTNQNGISSGLTVPSSAAQINLIKDALQKAGLQEEAVDYLEAHGTGTALGDPIEVRAIGEIFNTSHAKERPLILGTVKSNIGHLESAAGIAGLLKVVLSLQNETIPANLHFQKPSPHIDWEKLPISVATENFPWVKSSQKKRIAGVSSFGFSGTNAHVILEEAPAVGTKFIPPSPDRSHHLICLSAKNEGALQQMVHQYQKNFQTIPDTQWKDVTYTANTKRVHFNHRAAFVGSSKQEMTELLQAFSQRQPLNPPPNATHKIAFLLSGQGAQYPKMAYELYHTHPLFKSILEACHEISLPFLQEPLLDVIYHSSNPGLLRQTQYTQPAIFAVNYALARLWQSWGVQPDYLIGHSVGEYIAACLAGIFSLEEALTLLLQRAQLMQALPAGKMTAVLAPEDVVGEMLAGQDQVSIAAYNSPGQIVISGEGSAMDKLVENFQQRNITVQPLQVSHAFHSPMMEPILEKFENIARQMSFQTPQIPIVSNLTGKLSLPDEHNATYWAKHIKSPVRFEQSMQTLAQTGCNIFLEISPSPVLAPMGKHCVDPSFKATWLSSLHPKRKDWQFLLQNVARFYEAGGQIDFEAFEKPYPRQWVTLPHYPFQRKSYWATHQTLNMNTYALKEPSTPKSQEEMTSIHLTEIQERVQLLIGELLRENPTQINMDVPFLEMGADSILLAEASKKIENAFGIHISIRQFFEELATPNDLAAFLAEKTEPTVPTNTQGVLQPDTGQGHTHGDDTEIRIPQPTPDPISASNNPVAAIVQEQLLIMKEQLRLLGQAEVPMPSRSSEGANPDSQKAVKTPPPQSKPIIDPFASFRNQLDTQFLTHGNDQANASSIKTIRERGLNEQQKKHLEDLIDQFTRKTSGSRKFAATNRPHLADNRTSAGFRFSTKEMLYPIVGKDAKGAKVWDIDGNEYIDISMGFGVNFFGHQPSFIAEAIEKQLQKGYSLGPQAEMAGEVAKLIAKLTKKERVAFCNSGTEAVMTAIRLARTATQRQKIALFAGAYHGHFDGVLGTAKNLNIDPHGAAAAPGIIQNMVEDILVLDYDNPVSLEILQEHSHELAGVLVEPVQSRRPALQPKDFLKKLREWTASQDIPLIFDEIITGFRIHPGGAQAWFDIEADIATYGKIVGGGLPIGVVAGKASYMDCIDGGSWHFEDTSYPATTTTFFAGTFCKHPLTMAAALATLQEMERKGPGLQEDLNRKTNQLAATLNQFFQDHHVAMKVVNFGSLFRFEFNGNMDLFFFHLLLNGLYIWEGRNFFLSTAHTEEDIQKIIAAVKKSIYALQEGGFLTDIDSHQHRLPAEVSTESNQKYIIPLTDAQKQLWTLAAMDGKGGIAYNIPSNLLLKGPIDQANMEKAIAALIQRHEALRTTIDPEGNEQLVHKEFPYTCPMVDFTAHEHDWKEQFHQWNVKESQTPFDLVNGPLFRFYLLKINSHTHILTLTVPHINLDGWSVVLLLKELGMIYSALCQNKDTQLSPALQFRDFVQYLKEDEQTGKMQAAEKYWLEKLSLPLPLLELPGDYPWPRIKSYEGGRIHDKMEAGLIEDVKNISKKNKSTLFMSLLAAYLLLLHKLSRTLDIVVGIPVSGRVYKSTETILGYCSHLLPFRTDIRPEATFESFLQLIRKILLEGLEHERFPYAKLMQLLGEKVDLLSNPLTRATFNMDPMDSPPSLHNLEIEILSPPLSYMAYDLTLNIIETPQGYEMEWNFNTDIFHPETIRLYKSYYQAILTQIVDNPSLPLEAVTLISNGQPQPMIHPNHEMVGQNMATQGIHELFEVQAAKSPQATAFLFEDKPFTYEWLNEKANQLAHYLLKKAQLPEKVGIYLERSPEMVVSMIAALKAGVTLVPLDIHTPPERLQFIMQEVEAESLLSHKQLSKRLSLRKEVTVILLDEASDEIENENKENLNIPVAPEGVAYIMYTSGSSGKPKGVMGHHQGVVNYLQYLFDTYHIDASDTCIQLASMGFDASLRELLAPLSKGASVVIPQDQKNLPEVAKLIAKHSVTCLLSAVPSMISKLIEVLEQASWKNTTVRLVLVSGEIFQTDLWKKLKEKFGEETLIVNQYGPTECTMTSTYYIAHHVDEKHPALLIGKPIPNVTLYILDENRQPTPTGVPGEVYIGGQGVSKGYFKQAALTDHLFIQNPWGQAGQKLYKTGDIAKYLPDGNLAFIGRIDNQVKVRGYRIELEEIEAVLGQHTAIQHCAVITTGNAPEEKQIEAYIVPSTSDEITAKELQAFLHKILPDYMLPAKYVILKQIPLTPNGKIDRKALPGLAHREIHAGTQFVAPDNPLEEAILDMWTDLLGKEKISTQDEFFSMGGNSLKAIQLIGRIKKNYQVLLNIRDIFSNPTIQQLGKLISAQVEVHQDTSQTGDIVPLLPNQPYYEVSHAQQRVWILNQFKKEQIAYNISCTYTYQGKLNRKVFQQAFNSLVERHESLRTTFVTIDGLPKQKIHAPKKFNIQYLNLSMFDAAQQKEKIDKETAEELFDLQNGPLLKIKLLQLQKKEYLIFCSVHHIISDGWSMNILLRDVLQLYHAYLESKPNPLEPLSIQFKDFVVWQNRQLTGPHLQKLQSFWLKQFEGKLPTLNLPYDLERSGIQSFNGNVHSFTLNQETSRQILGLTSKYEVTLFMILLAYVKVILYRYTGQHDIIIGTPVGGREQKELENQIGFYINTVALRSQFSPNTSFESFLKEIKATTLAAYDHAIYPFDKLVEDLHLESDLSRTQLFDVMVQIQDAHTILSPDKILVGFPKHLEEDIRNNTIRTNNQISKFDLTFNFRERDPVIEVDIEYNTDLFYHKTIENLERDFIRMIREINKDFSVAISNQTLLPLEEDDANNDFIKPLNLL